MSKSKYMNPFNSFIECGLRSLIILENSFPSSYDLQRLVFYDYLLIHSKDAGGPESIHPATPNRSSEFLVKRRMIENGLLFMVSKGLVKKSFDKKGIVYSATEESNPFLDSLTTNYSRSLKNYANWVVTTFDKYSDESLEDFFCKHLDRWGGEFEREAILKYKMA